MADLGTQLLLNSFTATAHLELSPDTDAAMRQGLEHLQRGEYVQALACSLRTLWAAAGDGSSEPESTPDWFEAFQAAMARRLGSGLPESSAAGEDASSLPLLAAVAALYLFLQTNLTGPSVVLPECPFELLDTAAAEEAVQQAAAGAPPPPAAAVVQGGLGRDTISPGDRWAISQLEEDGEEVIGRISSPQYLLLARAILLAPAAIQQRPAMPAGPAGLAGPAAHSPAAAAAEGSGAAAALREGLPAAWAWWALRVALLQQRALAGRSATLRWLLEGLAQQVLASYAPAPKPREQPEQQQEGTAAGQGQDALARLLRSAALLEVALIETAFGYVESAGQYLQASCQAAGFHAELTGALGVRTQHQKDAKAQLVVHVERGDGARALEAIDVALDASVLEAELASSHGVGEQVSQELQGLQPDVDVLPHPKLVDQGEGAGLPTDLSSLEQALLLALSTHVKKGSSADGLKPWEAAAYADAVEQQQRSQFLLRAAARLAAVRFEKERARTRERALLALEQLVGAMHAWGSVPPRERVRLAFSVWFPLSVSLRKELGELLVAAGVIGAALPLFESLELWDSLAVCYQLLGKKVQAEQLVRRRLEATPDEPRLWCALGDLTLDDKFYQEAWERSGHRSARAQRSLARNAIRRSDWAGAARHWELALALNPLNPEGWFSLGFAYIKEKDFPKALQACSRCVQLDPENGEAWNNLAAIHMGAGRWAEAFASLGEATKHKQESWQTWENYADVAAKVGQWQVAVRALRHVLALSQGARVQLGILGEVVREVERARGTLGHATQSVHSAHGGGPADGGQGAGATAGNAAAAAEGAGAPPAATAEAPEEGQQGAGADMDAGAGAGMEALAQALASMGSSTPSAPGASDLLPQQVQQEGGGAAAEAAAAAGRERDALERAAGALMKELAGSTAGDSAFWDLYARFYAAIGQAEAARECLLKRVRALQGRGWQQAEEGFTAFADASLQLCRSYLEEGGPRELSAARMHLRGVLKQAAERFCEHPLYADMRQLLARAEEAQAQAQRQQ